MILVINSLLSAALITFLIWLDRYEKENIVILIRIFAGTVIATSIYALLVSNIIREISTINVVIIAPFLEETFKLVIFMIVLNKWNKEINESFDAVVYMGIIALGFAFYENISYYIAATWHGARIAHLTDNLAIYQSSLYSIFLSRLAPGHLLFNITAILPFGLYLQKKKRARYLIIGWFTAMILHSVWNLLANNNLIFCFYVAFLFVAAIMVILKLLSISEFKKEPEFGDEAVIGNVIRYDWSYYLMVYLFVIISGVISFLCSYLLTTIVYSIF